MNEYLESFKSTNSLFIEDTINLLNDIHKGRNHSKKVVAKKIKESKYELLSISYEQSSENHTSTTIHTGAGVITFMHLGKAHVRDQFNNCWSFREISDVKGENRTYELYKFTSFNLNLTLSLNEITYSNLNIKLSNDTYTVKTHKINNQPFNIVSYHDSGSLEELNKIFEIDPTSSANFLLKDEPFPKEINDLLNLTHDLTIYSKSHYLDININKPLLEYKKDKKSFIKKIFNI